MTQVCYVPVLAGAGQHHWGGIAFVGPAVACPCAGRQAHHRRLHLRRDT